jgi:hypothetical protein
MNGLELINEEECVTVLLESHAVFAFYLKNGCVITKRAHSWIDFHDSALPIYLDNIVNEALYILLHDDIFKTWDFIVV